ncbi:FAD/NAD(P)-binding domain-containing protein [Polyporus arcularius HHB13444]|uniref:FAD/NAD(P)-binding domain-containing protein n=1 Tax=Polyporus arcularius HHB13444 TaxID=1314778 RepID=A0A5C3PSM6_9APHY|nr:FAD/NAD(P)-binding domain-containing protein [Polyporus arcularius HHB13444]
MPTVSRNAMLNLDFLVVGGGIGGLAVAYVLSKAGHRVRVLERHDFNVPSGGQRVPPNLSKILRQWVGEEELMKISTRCVGTPFHHLRTGDLVGYFHWKPAVMAETGGEFLLMHHDDLVRLLHRLATGAGAKVLLNSKVTSIRQGTRRSSRPKVTLANGDVLIADILIGADGYKSIVRDVVLGEEDCAKPGGMTLYTGVIKAEDMLQDPELRPYALADEWPIFMGAHRSVCGHPVRAKKEFFFHLYSWHNLDGLEQNGEESWDEILPTEKINLENHGSKVQRLIGMAPHVIRTRFMSRKNGIHDWVDSSGRIVLLGDAAHPSFPGGSHGASMAVEDAVVLGSLFSHLRTMNQIPSFLSAYQELRQRRCDLVKLADIGNAQMVAMPEGPAADARDDDMRHTIEEWDEGTMKAQFEEIAEIFLYDAGDAAEEWWVNWGRFSQPARNQPSMMNLNFSSVTSTVRDD